MDIIKTSSIAICLSLKQYSTLRHYVRAPTMAMAVNDPREKAEHKAAAARTNVVTTAALTDIFRRLPPSAFTRMPTVAFNVLYVVKTVYGTCRKTEYEERVHGRSHRPLSVSLPREKSGRKTNTLFNPLGGRRSCMKYFQFFHHSIFFGPRRRSGRRLVLQRYNNRHERIVVPHATVRSYVHGRRSSTGRRYMPQTPNIPRLRRHNPTNAMAQIM